MNLEYAGCPLQNDPGGSIIGDQRIDEPAPYGCQNGISFIFSCGYPDYNRNAFQCVDFQPDKTAVDIQVNDATIHIKVLTKNVPDRALLLQCFTIFLTEKMLAQLAEADTICGIDPQNN